MDNCIERPFSKNGGCSAKLSGNELTALIRDVEIRNNADTNSMKVKAGFEDCGIVTLYGNTMLMTTDINPPVGHDAYLAGKIAVLHAVSDIYAMGGMPGYALIQFVIGENTTPEQNREMLEGIYDACREENVVVTGGHTVVGTDTLVGLSVIGEPLQDTGVLKKQNCENGDSILISKRIGTGLALRGYYNKLLGADIYREALDTMLESNRIGAEIAAERGLHALTDVTGFGLLGHLSEMLKEGQGAVIFPQRIPYISGIDQLQALQMRTSYTDANESYLRRSKKWRESEDTIQKMAMFDPQTNGPLLAVVRREDTARFVSRGFSYIGDIDNSNEITWKE